MPSDVEIFSFEPLSGPSALLSADPGPVADAMAAREAAAHEGFAAGMAAAEEQVQAALEPAVAALHAAAQELHADREHAVDALERAAVELALSLAEKMIAGALELQPERVLDVVRGALRGLVERERVLILVHPDDLAIVQDSIGRIATEFGGSAQFEVFAERRVTRGGALVRTEAGEIDASLATKLERAREVVERELGG